MQSKEKLVIIRTLAEMAELQAYLANKDVICLDTETTGVEKTSEIIGFSVCAELDVAYYVILSYWDVTAQKLVYLETKDGAKAVFESLIGKKLVAHNAVFDCWMIDNNFKVDLMPSIYVDTMIMAHLVNENRRVGLKELALSIYGEDATKEQIEMKASVTKNGGMMTKDCYELYKADADLIALYGAKDTILTMKVLYHILPELCDQNLDGFFFDDESMPMLRTATYDLNTTGLRVDTEKLQALKGTLEAECHEKKAFIYREIDAHIKDKYPGTSKASTFNIGAGQQISWLVFIKLGMEFSTLTDSGKDLCKALGIKLPYTAAAKRDLIQRLTELKGNVYEEAKIDPKTKKMSRPKKVGDPWVYMSCGAVSLKKAALRYKWVEALLQYKKNLKLLSTYVEGIQSRMQYGVIRPSFLQHGTTSGRYSSRNPNFQNLPRDDKRIKACIVARPGKVFVGADYAQLEPRVFASLSKDERLLQSFKDGDDFYSVIGAEVFNKTDCTLKKDDTADSFPVKYKKLRDVAKVIALATPYGTTAPQMASEMVLKAGQVKSMQECQDIIDNYFLAYPQVHRLMLDSHQQVKTHGIVYNLYGRPRRVPEALNIGRDYGKNTPHGDLPRAARNMLNQGMNFPIQSTGASIVNRAMTAFRLRADAMGLKDCKIVMTIHDEVIVECLEGDSKQVVDLLRDCMQNTATLPGVDLIAEPKVGKNLAGLK